MKAKITVFLISALSGMLWLSQASAHHGWGGYNDRIEGDFTIVELKLGNPHDRLIAEDAEGREWNLLLAPPARNRKFGFSKDSISVGDVVEILGQRHPSRLEMKVHCINKSGVNIYTYRYDNGRTSLERQRSDESCSG